MVGKICPNPYVYNTEKHTWQAFKEAVEKSNIKEAGIIANADGGMQIQKALTLGPARISECFNERDPEEYVTQIRNDLLEPDLVFFIPAALLENDCILCGCIQGAEGTNIMSILIRCHQKYDVLGGGEGVEGVSAETQWSRQSAVSNDRYTAGGLIFYGSFSHSIFFSVFNQ